MSDPTMAELVALINELDVRSEECRDERRNDDGSLPPEPCDTCAFEGRCRDAMFHAIEDRTRLERLVETYELTIDEARKRLDVLERENAELWAKRSEALETARRDALNEAADELIQGASGLTETGRFVAASWLQARAIEAIQPQTT